MLITGDFFERIQDRDVFEEAVHIQFAKQAESMGLELHWNRGRAYDAFFQWKQDLERVEQFEANVSKADHLKCAAHLIYWLRRNSPVENFVHTAPIGFNEDPEYRHIDFMMKYGREYLAFDLGYRAAQLYETKLNDRNLPAQSFLPKSSLPDVPGTDFIETVVHVLKTKNVSPHAIFLVLKAMFLRP